VQVDGRVLAIVILAMGVTTIVAGLVPALRISSLGPASALRIAEGGRTTAPTQHAQRGMLVAQMAVSTVLLVCAALLAKTFIQLRAEALGFVSDDVTLATVVLPTTPFNSGSARYAFLCVLRAIGGTAAGTAWRTRCCGWNGAAARCGGAHGREPHSSGRAWRATDQHSGRDYEIL
jgi:hypothetical protein